MVNRKDPNVNTFAQPKKHDTRNATKRHEATRKDTKTTRHVTKRHETARNHMKTTRNDAQHETSWKDTKNVTERRKNVTKRRERTRKLVKRHETDLVVHALPVLPPETGPYLRPQRQHAESGVRDVRHHLKTR